MSMRIQDLPVLRMDFRLTFKTDPARLDWPPFTIRGALGYALKRLCCTMSIADCAACPRRAECIYSYLFETPVALEARMFMAHDRAPHPFVIIPGAKMGNELGFGIMLFGEAVRYAGLFASAVLELADDGLGSRKARFDLQRITVTGDTRQVWEPGMAEPTIVPGRLAEFLKNGAPPDPSRPLELTLLTPLRLQVRRTLTRQPSFRDILAAGLRRISSVCLYHGGLTLDLAWRDILEEAARVQTLATVLTWQPLERRSSRTGQIMPSGGIVGNMTFAPGAHNFVEYLQPLTLMGLGKQTVFGLGRIGVG